MGSKSGMVGFLRFFADSELHGTVHLLKINHTPRAVCRLKHLYNLLIFVVYK